MHNGIKGFKTAQQVVNGSAENPEEYGKAKNSQGDNFAFIPIDLLSIRFKGPLKFRPEHELKNRNSDRQ